MIQNECLLAESVSKYICSVVLTSDIAVPMSVEPRSNCVKEHSRNLKLEAEILKVCNNSSSPELNVFFEINKLKDQLQGKDELLRKLEPQIGNMNEVSADSNLSTLEFQALETENTQLKEELTAVRIKNDSLRDESMSIKKHYQDLYQSKAESNSNVSSRAAVPERPKVLTPGMYAMTPKCKRIENGAKTGIIGLNLVKSNYYSSSDEVVQELIRKLLEDVQNISEELAEFINSPSWSRLAFYLDDDEEYTIAITPDLPTEEPDNSLSMGDEHLDIIPATESDEVIKSSVENLVSIPSESEDFSDIKSECDVPVCDDSTKFSNPLFDSDNDFSSSDDELFSDKDVPKEIYSNPLFDEEIISDKIDDSIISSPKIDSPLGQFSGELAHIDLIPPRINEDNLDPDGDIHLVEKLLYDNSSPRPPEELNSTKSFPPSHIPVEDSDPFMEEIDLFLASDESIPPGIDSDYSDSEGDNLFLEKMLYDDPTPLPDIPSPTHVTFPFEDHHDLDFTCVVRVFLPFFTHPVTSSFLFSSGSEDTIFDPSIFAFHFSLQPVASHRSETFMCFNVYLNILNESLIEIFSSKFFVPTITMIWGESS
ncbi:hypothetical protein Tco_0321909 [Tanacetum coccineum]